MAATVQGNVLKQEQRITACASQPALFDKARRMALRCWHSESTYSLSRTLVLINRHSQHVHAAYRL